MYWEFKVNKNVTITDFKDLSVTDDAVDKQRRTNEIPVFRLDEFEEFSIALSEGAAPFLKHMTDPLMRKYLSQIWQ